MKKFKVLLCAAVVLAASSVYAAKDMIVTLPTGNWIVDPFNTLSVSGWAKDKFQGRNIACKVSVFNSIGNVPLPISITTSNFQQEPGDTPDGAYEISPAMPFNFVKMNIHSINQNYYSYIRLFNLSKITSDSLLINCNYF